MFVFICLVASVFMSVSESVSETAINTENNTLFLPMDNRIGMRFFYRTAPKMSFGAKHGGLHSYGCVANIDKLGTGATTKLAFSTGFFIRILVNASEQR